MSKKSGGGLGLNKLSFWLIGIVAIIELVVMLLGVFGIGSAILRWIEVVSLLLLAVVVGILAWRYVRNSGIAWKLLYFIFMLIFVVCVVLHRALW